MYNINIPLVGASYESRTVPLSAQVTRNMYPEPVAAGLSPSALLSWPGSKLFSTGSGVNRGIYEWGGVVYAVNGQKLYKVNSAGTQTEVGDVSGGGRCIFAADSNYLYFVTSGKLYRTDGSTVEVNTDADNASPTSIAFLNGTFFFTGSDGYWSASFPGNGFDVSALDKGQAESVFDTLNSVYAFNQQLYFLGSKSVEPWYVNGSIEPPISRIEGGLSQVGSAGPFCVTHTDKTMYFLGNDRSIHYLSGYQAVPASSIAVSNAIESYETVSDCFAFSLKLQGQNFVFFSFPSAGKTWVYSEAFGFWFESSSGVGGGRHVANGYCRAFGKHLISDCRNGNIYEWDLSTFTDNGLTIERVRTTQPFYSEKVAEPGKHVFWNRLELVLNSGSGLVVGQGENPQVMMQYSDDLGRTWSNELWRSAGALGAYQWRVTWDSLGSSLNRIYRFKVTDPIECHFFKLSADIEVGL